MAPTNTKLRRAAVAGGLAFAALTLPALAAVAVAPTASATGKCLAWFGSRDDGICMGYSNGNPTYIGTPNLGIYGPGGGFGVTTGPLLPGQTISQGIGN